MQNFVRQFHYTDDHHLPIIRGVGIGEGSSTYNWDARIRKEQLIVLQVTLTGEGFLEMGGRKIALRENNAFFAKIPGNYRYFGEKWRFLFIEFSTIMTQWLDTSISVIELSMDLIERLKSIVIDLKDRELSAVQNAKISFALFLDIKEAIQKEIQQKTDGIQAVKKYIDTHYFEDISLDFLSERYMISKYTLIRQFEEVYKSSPINYLKQVRIIQSLSLLWEEEAIGQVAKKVGFSTGNYFSKVFKKEMGMSPSEYRNQKEIYFPR
ncbi:helix-turn-helix domain-containing protein [Enterococcus ureasiticus]|uniref:HTH araC/xylS-type domain-containing protein n=1 Tax=Enterococcus ureasiticus TaxID=903984 RepID=A0A1E5GAG1_9ENTE|nr:AraC family transcriptional regulator [Enterococcus ureasiticus]OEG09641.1 hypothetical protein BCR21_14965 [Enterococcus ureasiticus]